VTFLFYPHDIVGIGNGMVAVAAIVLLQILMSKLVEKNKDFAFLVEGNPTLLVQNGKILRQNLDDEDLSEDDLMEMLREQSISSLSNTKKAYLERSGDLGLILKTGKKRRVKRKRVLF